MNSAGGIKVTGTLDCTTAFNDFVTAVQADPAVTSWKNDHGYTGLVDVRLTTLTPSGVGWVPVNPHFTATQYVGRTRVISAYYGSGIAQSCHYTDESGPCPWSTLYGFLVGGDQWVYSSTGKFSAGRIHIEMSAQGSIEATAYAGNVEIATFTQDLYGLSGWDLRAQKVRR